MCSCVALYQRPSFLTGQQRERGFFPETFNNNALLVTRFPFLSVFFFLLLHTAIRFRFYLFQLLFAEECDVYYSKGIKTGKEMSQRENKFRRLFPTARVNAFSTLTGGFSLTVHRGVFTFLWPFLASVMLRIVDWSWENSTKMITFILFPPCLHGRLK